MTPWEKEKVARRVLIELDRHPSDSWFTPQAIVAIPEFECDDAKALAVFSDLIERDMLVSAPMAVPFNGQNIFVSAWKVNDANRVEIDEFKNNGGFWHLYIIPTIKWFWGISRYRLLVIITFIIAAFCGGFFGEAGSNAWGGVAKWFFK